MNMASLSVGQGQCLGPRVHMGLALVDVDSFSERFGLIFTSTRRVCVSHLLRNLTSVVCWCLPQIWAVTWGRGENRFSQMLGKGKESTWKPPYMPAFLNHFQVDYTCLRTKLILP